MDAGPADRIYAVTGDYADIARNHCAATMMTNLMLVHYGEDPGCRDRRALFRDIHRFIGNGPVLHIAGRANRYLRENRIPMTCAQRNRHLTERDPGRLITAAQEELHAGRPCGLLVAASPLQWHWVLAIAAERDTAGATSFRIADGWHAGRVLSYIPDRGARLLGIAIFRQ